MAEKKPRSDKRISLAPLTPDEALKAALQVKPKPKDEKGKAADPDEGKGRA